MRSRQALDRMRIVKNKRQKIVLDTMLEGGACTIEELSIVAYNKGSRTVNRSGEQAPWSKECIRKDIQEMLASLTEYVSRAAMEWQSMLTARLDRLYGEVRGRLAKETASQDARNNKMPGMEKHWTPEIASCYGTLIRLTAEMAKITGALSVSKRPTSDAEVTDALTGFLGDILGRANVPVEGLDSIVSTVVSGSEEKRNDMMADLNELPEAYDD